ncbi:MAG: hypothetical protein A2X23_09240 [Chloroflexi bacterium GWC2_73_18]|nr:MAG: hypothetical protein A2X23_09240 [Chloroflexi bacterium GWC2_73_18]
MSSSPTVRGRRRAPLRAAAFLAGALLLAAAGPALAKEVNIAITGFSFPATMTVTAETPIVWVNQTGAPHTATADDGSFDTGRIDAGATSGAIVIDTPGSYAYYCQYHGGPGGTGMSGVLVVEAAGTATPTPAGGGPTPPPTDVLTVAPGEGGSTSRLLTLVLVALGATLLLRSLPSRRRPAGR